MADHVKPDTPGTSSLTPEQQQWFVDHHGRRYLHVQDNADIPSRRDRRAAAKRARRKR